MKILRLEGRGLQGVIWLSKVLNYCLGFLGLSLCTEIAPLMWYTCVYIYMWFMWAVRAYVDVLAEKQLHRHVHMHIHIHFYRQNVCTVTSAPLWIFFKCGFMVQVYRALSEPRTSSHLQHAYTDWRGLTGGPRHQGFRRKVHEGTPEISDT